MEPDYDACEHFRDELRDYLNDYQKHLLTQVKTATVGRHIHILALWADYICLYKSLTDFSGLTVALSRSAFYGYFKSYNDDALPPVTVYNTIKRFLLFVQEQYGIANKQLLDKLVKA